MNEAESHIELDAPTTISVWDALYELGFTPDSSVISEVLPGLSYDFGNFKLSASTVTSRYFRKIVLFTGVLAAPRRLTEVHFELASTVDSREQLTAFLASCLDEAAGDEGFCPLTPVEWLSDGRTYSMLLPRELERTTYGARPHCVVARDWMRQALNCLKEILGKAEDVAAVDFSFDGKVLMISCCGQVFPVPAEGNPWPAEFTIPAVNLRELPRRFSRRHIEVSVYKDKLQIGNKCFQGALEKTP